MLRWVRFEEHGLSSLSNFKDTSCLAGYNNHNDNTWLIFKPPQCFSDKRERKTSAQSLAGSNRVDIRADFEKKLDSWSSPHSGLVICKNLCNTSNFCVIFPTPSASDCQERGKKKESFLDSVAVPPGVTGRGHARRLLPCQKPVLISTTDLSCDLRKATLNSWLEFRHLKSERFEL